NTTSQRIKETSDDYRYFPEPDIPPIELSDEYIESLRSELSESPQEKLKRYVSEYGLDKYTAEVIVSDLDKMNVFEKAIESVTDKIVIVEVSKIVIGMYSNIVKDIRILDEKYFNPLFITELARLTIKMKLPGVIIKEVLTEAFETGKSPKEIIEEKGLSKKIEESQLQEIVKKVLDLNQKVVSDVKTNPNAIMFLVGQVMKETKGKANASEVRNTLEELIRDR
ncbi:MAG: Asp-tRNA(Asn)/Glu-tRNA(Gln) amidotransferase GatCAB subunit B, partial [bacterium]